MTDSQAEQIAALINERNQLEVRYSADRVSRDADLYEYEMLNDTVVACVQRKELQWYQWEILHLSVRKQHEGKGLAYKVYKRAEGKANARGVRLLQCTIREGNRDSERFFERQHFQKVNRFRNPGTGNNVGVWQKILSEATPPSNVIKQFFKKLRDVLLPSQGKASKHSTSAVNDHLNPQCFELRRGK